MLTLVADCYGSLITFPLRDDLKEIRAGSLPDNTIYLPYKGVSRHHFSLTRRESRWFLQDRGSKNGILLNGQIITEAFVKPGDVIQAGIIHLTVQSAKEELEPVAIPKMKTVASGDSETDKVGHIPLSSQERVFSFPELVFPEGLILGKSHLMLEVYQKLHSIACSEVNVLFIGETGVGKEVFAHTLHQSGVRSGGPFVAVNCAAIPAELAEAELFGIGEKVATDVNRRKGKMALAHKGTLFFDELSSFPMALQAKVLRAIEDRLIYPVGENEPQQVDFRVTAATNQDPAELIRAGKLREDLYHRLATIEIRIPALRERNEDLPVLIMGLLQQISNREGKFISGISKRLYSALLSYIYPGNVRELGNLVSGMIALAHPGEVLDIHHVPEKVFEKTLQHKVEDVLKTNQEKTSINLHETIDEVTKRLILHALSLHPENLTRAARYLNVTPYGLRKMMKRLGIHKEDSAKIP